MTALRADVLCTASCSGDRCAAFEVPRLKLITEASRARLSSMPRTSDPTSVESDRQNTLTAMMAAWGDFSRMAAVTAVPCPRRSTKSSSSDPSSRMPMPCSTPPTCGWAAKTPLSTTAMRTPRPVYWSRNTLRALHDCPAEDWRPQYQFDLFAVNANTAYAVAASLM